MKYLTRSLKGTYGYIRKQTVFECIKTAVMFAMAFGLYFIGYLTLHTNKSLWSVLAVLALLPASKSMVGVIMLARFRSLNSEDHDRYERSCDTLPVLYENILTTRERTFYVPVICVAKGAVNCFAKLDAKDVNTLSEHLSAVLKSAGHNAVVKVFNDESAFCERVSGIDKSTDKYNAEPVISTIKAVSL